MNEQHALKAVRSSGSSAANEQPLRLQSSEEQGRAATVIRDPEGRIAYPSIVPPETTSPNSPNSPPPMHAPDQVDAMGTRQTSTTSAMPTDSAKRPDPAMGKRRATDGARGGVSGSSALPALLRRAGTNASELDRALWLHQSQAHDASSSSESSSDEEEENQGLQGTTSSQSRPAQQKKNSHYGRFHVENEHYSTKGRVSKKDGRLNITLNDTSNTGYLAKALGTAAKKVIPLGDSKQKGGQVRQDHASRLSEASTIEQSHRPVPRLNIVIMVIGSRGDAQPFLKIGKVLKEQYGHRVRIATHPAFRDFVEKDSGLEFFSVGGDPSELMAFMVKNPGMIPTLETVKAGDIGKRRSAMAEMFEGFWRACINATDDEKDVKNLRMMGDRHPFVADAIIANPPSFAHIHCAEALGIPLHIMFTFPYTPTQAFPHPLASIKKSNVDPGYTNFISYPLVEMMVWQGLGDLVNDFRAKTLGLDPVSTLWAPGALYRLHVPVTYLWSPGLVPKPEDWGDEVDVSGFVFLDLASSFKPPEPLTKFLEAGEDPIYIGFGSIVVDDADRFTQMIFEAVRLAGVRALVSKGWGGLGGDSLDVPDNVFLLDNTPHDWLFPKVRACVIHGGAGTTAIALKCGKPTFVVPFFGDQHFWGTMLAGAKAGPEPVAYKQLTAENLAEGIKYCITAEAAEAAKKLAQGIEREGDGAENACQAFHKHITVVGSKSMRCSILDGQTAAWHLKQTNLRLSPLAAHILTEKGCISWRKLRLLRRYQYNDFEGPGEPLTGMAGSLVTSVGEVFSGVGGVPYRIAKSSTKRRERRRKKEAKAKEQAPKRQDTDHGNKQAKSSTQQQDQDGFKAGDTQAVDHATHENETIGASVDKNQPSKLAVDQDEDTEDANNNALSRPATHQTASTAELENPAEEVVGHVGRGAAKSARALAKAPVDLSVALAQGFHNAPRLYGDDTVRRPPRITGIRSGLRAAGHEFVYGIYDGWTGVVRLPVRGVRDGGGVRGLVSGIGMGLTGFVLKDIAAVVGPFGYTLKGLVKQAERRRQPTKYVRRARIVQGQREALRLGEKERASVDKEVAHGWTIMRELWEALDAEHRKQAGLKKWLHRRHGRRFGAVFEDVRTAELALVALRRGESIDDILDRGIDQPDLEDEGRSSNSKSHDSRERNDNKLTGTTPGQGTIEKQQTKSIDAHGRLPDHFQESSRHTAMADPEEEARNPFAADLEGMAKNREENQEVEAEALEVVAKP